MQTHMERLPVGFVQLSSGPLDGRHKHPECPATGYLNQVSLHLPQV